MMFKNLLDKAKSAIDDVDNAIKLAGVGAASLNLKTKKQPEFDSSLFTFQLEGGPIHTSKLNAVAKVKSGINKFLFKKLLFKRRKGW